MHKFFETLNPDMVKRFEALMTNERAEFFLMDRTLGDATLITQENYEDIYRDIEEAAAERVAKRIGKQIESLKEEHEKKIVEMTKVNRERHLEETTRSAKLEAEVRERDREAERLAAEKGDLEGRLAESDQRWADACLRKGTRAGLRAWGGYVVVLAVVTVATPFIPGDGLVPTIFVGVLTFIVALLGSVVGNRFWPGNPIDRLLDGRREKAALEYAQDHGVEELLSKYKLDWSKNRAELAALIEDRSEEGRSDA